MSIRSFLLASVSSVAIVGVAQAADLPVKVAPLSPVPVANWQGLYFGVHAGAGRVNNTQNSFGTDDDNGSCMGSSSCSISANGGLFGLQLGYNWQSRYFVYGIEGDWSWADISGQHSSLGTSSPATFNTKVDWLGSIRGRMGLALDNTLVYFTGGIAFAGTKSGWGGGYSSFPNTACGAICSDSSTGWVAGLGVEHMFDPHWSFRGEALYYSFGDQTRSAVGSGGETYNTVFHHEVFVARAGLNYKW